MTLTLLDFYLLVRLKNYFQEHSLSSVLCPQYVSYVNPFQSVFFQALPSQPQEIY